MRPEDELLRKYARKWDEELRAERDQRKWVKAFNGTARDVTCAALLTVGAAIAGAFCWHELPVFVIGALFGIGSHVLVGLVLKYQRLLEERRVALARGASQCPRRSHLATKS